MAYEYNFDTNEWDWVGPEPQPQIGETKTEYGGRIGLVPPGDPAGVGFPVGETTLPEWESRLQTGMAPLVGGTGGTALGWLLRMITGGGILGTAAGLGAGILDVLTEGDVPYQYGEPGGGYMSNGDVDLYGRSGVVMNGGGVPVGGPGVPEPPAAMVAKHWQTTVYSPKAAFLGMGGSFNIHFFKLVDGRVMSFNPLKNQWKMWRPKKPLAVIYRGKTTLSQAVKVQKYLDQLWKTVARKTKALKLAK